MRRQNLQCAEGSNNFERGTIAALRRNGAPRGQVLRASFFISTARPGRGTCKGVEIARNTNYTLAVFLFLAGPTILLHCRFPIGYGLSLVASQKHLQLGH
jgi:hypothetical protein